MGSLARAGSEVRPGSERRRPAAGGRPVPPTGQNTVLPAHSGLRTPFTTEEWIRSVDVLLSSLPTVGDKTREGGGGDSCGWRRNSHR